MTVSVDKWREFSDTERRFSEGTDMMASVTLKALQYAIRQVDHRPDEEYFYLTKLVEEVGEVARALRSQVRWRDTGEIKGTLDEELFDVLYYVAALANLYEVDLEAVLRAKDALNAAKYDHAPLLAHIEQMDSGDVNGG